MPRNPCHRQDRPSRTVEAENRQHLGRSRCTVTLRDQRSMDVAQHHQGLNRWDGVNLTKKMKKFARG